MSVRIARDKPIDIFLVLCTGSDDLIPTESRVLQPKSTKAAWRGDYCCVPLCRTSSGQNIEREMLGLTKVSFHCFPDVDSEKGKQWLAKIRRDPGEHFVVNEYTKICSQHFTSSDFVSLPKCPSIRARLIPSAIPSIFPWSEKRVECGSVTSKRAMYTTYYNYHMQSTEGSKPDGDCMGKANHPDSVECIASDHSLDPSNELQFLRQKVSQLQTELLLANDSASKSLFRLKNIQDSDEEVKCYTGFPDYATLFAFYEVILESDATVMRQWDGKNDYNDESKRGRHTKLPLLEQFFLTLVRLRLGLYKFDLANRFNISQSTVS